MNRTEQESTTRRRSFSFGAASVNLGERDFSEKARTPDKGQLPIGKAIVRSLSWLTVCVLCLCALVYSSEVKEAVFYGMRLGATVVVPAIFPFMIFADYFGSVPFEGGVIGRAVCRFFGISPRLFGALILGNIFGFPVGVRMAVRLYDNGAISKCELENSIGILNNPSLSFLLLAAELAGDYKVSLVIVISVYIATALVGIVFKNKTPHFEFSGVNTGQKFIFSESLKSAAISCLGVCACISFFSAGIALIKILSGSEIVGLLFATVSEVTTAVDLITASSIESGLKAAILAFSLGFSGLSVHMQAFGFLPDKISKRRYLLMKISEGIFAFVICLLFSSVK